jgi:phage/plasmid-like protein (TIGR03299 family)
MAHQIAIVNGQASLAYTGKRPWHGLGTQVDHAMTAAEAMAAANLNYEVEKWPVYVHNPYTGEYVRDPSRWKTVRTDTGDWLGDVSSTYKIFQNAEGFALLDQIVASGELRYETAGAIGVGERVWMLARVPGEIRVRKSQDVSAKYLLCALGHDGATGITVFFTSIRVVCANTWRAAFGAVTTQVRITHTGNLASKVIQARDTLGLAHCAFERAAEAADFLAGVQVSSNRLTDYFRAIFPDPQGQHAERPGAQKATEETRSTLRGLFETGLGADIPEIRGSYWAAYHAVTEYVDHFERATASESRQLDHIWFGTGARLKDRAFSLAIDHANAAIFAGRDAVSLN